jgi:hypothetical protein
VLPFLLLILAFTLSREVWFHEPVSRANPSPEDKDEADRRKLDSLHGRVVLPFKQAAE